MHTTRLTLIDRIRDGSDGDAWSQFEALYGPLIYRHARKRGLNREDAEDVRSKCYESVFKQIKAFDYDKCRGGFKAWLFTMTNRRVIEVFRKRKAQQADTDMMNRVQADEPGPEELWQRQWKKQHLRYCVDQIRQRVNPENYEAFRLHVLEELPVEAVCERLELQPNRVYKAKSRILKLIRQKMAEIGYDEAAAEGSPAEEDCQATKELPVPKSPDRP